MYLQIRPAKSRFAEAVKTFHFWLKREHPEGAVQKRNGNLKNLPGVVFLANSFHSRFSPMNVEAIRIQRPSTNSKLFAHTRWDAVPAAAGLFHFAYFLGLFFLYPHAPLWVMLILGFIYSLMVNANINGVSHNFIHNPFFRSQLLNRIFGVIESVACCFSQTYYDVVHLQHHKGNADRPDENGETIDWISIYKHGHDGEAENPWGYVFLSFFRDNPGAIQRELAKRGKIELRWGNIELAVFITILITMAVIVPTRPIHF